MNAGVLGRFLAHNANPGRNADEPNETWSVRVGVAAWPSLRSRRIAMRTKRSGAVQGGAPRLFFRLCRRPKTDVRAEAGPSPPKGRGARHFWGRQRTSGTFRILHFNSFPAGHAKIVGGSGSGQRAVFRDPALTRRERNQMTKRNEGGKADDEVRRNLPRARGRARLISRHLSA